MLKRIKSKVAGVLVASSILVGLGGALAAAPAQASASGPGASGCYSYDATFNHQSGRGYWSATGLNCNRIFWLESVTKMTPPGGSARAIDDIGSGWLSGSRPSTYYMGGREFACTHNAGYQNVAIVWFRDANGNAYQGGYFTSGAPRAFC
jgi:hypothetical protein